MTMTRADSVSVTQLSSAVSDALTLAAKRHAIATDENSIIANWELIGRLVPDALTADNFSQDVAAELTKSFGQEFEPGTLKIGKQILAGFFEKARMPVIRGI
jgi:hypothetical protein